MAGRLGVDYVVWGKVLPQNATVQTAAYRRSDGQPVVKIAFSGDHGRLTDVILTAASKDENGGEAIVQLARTVKENAAGVLLGGPIAEGATTTAELLSAIESLEQALAYPVGSDESMTRLENALRSAAAAAAAEPRNAIAHWLSANASFNLAAADYRAGNMEAANQRMSRSRSSLRRASREVRRLKSKPIAAEILADAALLLSKKIDDAVKLYTDLTDEAMPQASQLRGHWMLAGIRAGDWGVPDSVSDAEKSREHVIEILANWPESPEAVQLKQWLLWDDQADRARHNFLPLMNRDLGQADGV